VSRRIRTGPPAPVPGTPPAQPAVKATFTEVDEEQSGGSNETLLGTPVRSFTSASITYASKSTTADPPDGYIDRLLKYIPSEIIALYLGVQNVIPTQDKYYSLSLWIVSILTALIVPVYMYYMTREPKQPTPWSQILISSVAFPIWVFAIGGPFAKYDWYKAEHWIAAVIITFSTFLLGIYKPSDPSDTPDATNAPEPPNSSAPTVTAGAA
jgi:hypothetical protein